MTLSYSVQVLLDYVKSVKPFTKFTIVEKKDKQLAFLEVLITRMGCEFRIFVYSKPTLTERYVNFNSDHTYSVKSRIAQCLKHRAKNISGDSERNHEEMIQ